MFDGFIPGITPEGVGSYTRGPKGFTVPAEFRDDRDHTGDKMAWALAHKPGMVVVNGSYTRRVTERATSIRAAMFRQLARRYGKKVATTSAYGRFTPKGVLALDRGAA